MNGKLNIDHRRSLQSLTIALAAHYFSLCRDNKNHESGFILSCYKKLVQKMRNLCMSLLALAI